MATRPQAISGARARTSQSPQGLFSQITALLLQPRSFFNAFPHSRQWIVIGAVVLIVFGFAASRQAQTNDTATGTAAQSEGFSLALFQDESDTGTTASTQSTSTQSTTSGGTDTALMSALEAASRVFVMWAGQTLLLCLVPMFSGYRPRFAQSLQIAVWASLPLALMLALRQIYFTSGGTGGAVGLSLLLEEWDGYSALSSAAQDLLAAFMSQITFFWLWNLLLLFFGARYVLRGKYWAATLVIVIWIAVVPVVTVMMGDPVTTVSPRAETTTSSESTSREEDTASSGTTGTTAQFDMGGGFSAGGGMPSGDMGPGNGGGRP